jgi:hypothetical protein
MQAPPVFNGFDPMNQPISKFLQEFRRYVAIHNINQARWADILDTLIDEPARTAYEAAKGGNGIREDEDLGMMAVGPLAAEFRARYDARRTWLQNTYNGQEQQDRAKDILEEMYQGINETPEIFYNRIIAQVHRAGYAAAMMPVMARQFFMKGLHRDIYTKMMQQPRLELTESVALANRIWQSAHPAINQEVTLFPQQRQEELERRRELLIQDPGPQAYIPPRTTQRTPPQPRVNRDNFEQELEDLTKGFRRLQAQVNDRQGYNQRYGPPTQYFGNQRRPQQNQWNNQAPPRQEYRNPQPQGPRINQGPNCWKCGEAGHYARECQSEANSYAAPPANQNTV